jgi:hypothetical protein
MWGYIGIIIGLVALLAVFFVVMEILYRAPKTAGQNEASAEQRKPAPPRRKRAA